MKKEKRLIFILLVLILSTQVISAISSEVTVKTVPNHKIMISILKPGEIYSLIESFHKETGPTGEVPITFSYEGSTFDVAVWVKKHDNQLVVYKKFEDGFTTGAPLTLEVYPEGYVLPEPVGDLLEENSTINETIDAPINITNDTQEIIEETPEDSSGLTNFAVFGDNGIISTKTLYYIIGGVVLLIIIFFIFKFIKKRRQDYPREIKVRKLSEINFEKDDKLKEYEKILEDAEKQAKEAESEINKIKGQDKVFTAQRRLSENERRLASLRSR